MTEQPGAASPLETLTAAIPPRYRDAAADHPQVLAWAREVAEAAIAPARERAGRSRPAPAS
ncbi:hypothetical protein ACFQLX_05400 [Streptomyces polyrhachis]|uniref:Uncharacterized protein n=1 Tax=Streptomyces polyrhachis TaxID=1282885 RepID=A0ABW2GAM8_9ACTN